MRARIQGLANSPNVAVYGCERNSLLPSRLSRALLRSAVDTTAQDPWGLLFRNILARWLTELLGWWAIQRVQCDRADEGSGERG